jgi:prepilin-type N-terminal cleavage/methylation domain-containing protein
MKQTGFTLTELLIALVVITLTLAGYIGANIMLQRNAEEMHERTIAIQDANRTIERMRSDSRTGTFPGNVTAKYPDTGIVAGFTDLVNEQVTVSYADTAANPLDVTVRVTWLTYARRQGFESVRTYITQR